MGPLVEYALKQGQEGAQEAALADFVCGLNGLKASVARGFSHTPCATDDPTGFPGGARFAGPPSTTAIRRVASTRG